MPTEIPQGLDPYVEVGFLRDVQIRGPDRSRSLFFNHGQKYAMLREELDWMQKQFGSHAILNLQLAPLVRNVGLAITEWRLYARSRS